MHHADACGQRLKRRLEINGFPVQQNGAAVSACIADHVHSEQDFHQGGLACAVLADKPEDLALLQGEVDVGQYLIAEEILLDILHFQQRCVLTHLHPSLLQYLYSVSVKKGEAVASPFQTVSGIPLPGITSR